MLFAGVSGTTSGTGVLKYINVLMGPYTKCLIHNNGDIKQSFSITVSHLELISLRERNDDFFLMKKDLKSTIWTLKN